MPNGCNCYCCVVVDVIVVVAAAVVVSFLLVLFVGGVGGGSSGGGVTATTAAAVGCNSVGSGGSSVGDGSIHFPMFHLTLLGPDTHSLMLWDIPKITKWWLLTERDDVP